MATETKQTEKVEEVEVVQELDLQALAAEIAANDEAEQEILAKAEAIRKKRAEAAAAMQTAAEPIIAPFRPELEAIQTSLAGLAVVHKTAMDELRTAQAAERKDYEDKLEAILVLIEAEGVSRELVLPKKSSGGATGKRGPGVKAAALGVVGSADDPVKVTAPRRRVGDGVPEEHSYYCDGAVFYGLMKDGSWSQSERLSEVSSSHGWHDTKDVAAALAFSVGKPYAPMAHPGAVFANGVLVPNGASTEATETATV